MSDNRLKTYSELISEKASQGDSRSITLLKHLLWLPHIPQAFILVASEPSFELLTFQVALALITLQILNALVRYVPERTLLLTLSGVSVGGVMAGKYLGSVLVSSCGWNPLASMFSGILIGSLLGATAGLASSRFSWLWLERRVETFVDTLWVQSEPPQNSRGLPLDFHQLLYSKKPIGPNLRPDALFFASALFLLCLNALPTLEYALENISFQVGLLWTLGAWSFSVIGLCWLTQYLNPWHTALLVAPAAICGPLFFCSVAYGVLDALLVSLGGLLLARCLVQFFRAGHR